MYIKAITLAMVLTLPAVAFGQVSMSLVTSDGQDTLEVAPGAVAITLEIRVDSTTDLDGLQFAIFGSDADLFEYGPAPTVVFPTPTDPPTSFMESDLIPELTEFEAGTTVSDAPDLTLFTFNAPYPFSGQGETTVLTVNVRSINDLPEGIYTFTTGDSGAGYLWTNSADTVTSGEITAANVFTLDVTSAAEPVDDGPPGCFPQEAAGQMLGALALILLVRFIYNRF